MDRHQGLQCNDCISSFFSHRIRSSFDPSRRDVFVFMTFHALPMLSKKIVLAKGRDPTVSNRRHFEISIVRLARYRYDPPPIRGRSPANRPPLSTTPFFSSPSSVVHLPPSRGEPRSPSVFPPSSRGCICCVWGASASWGWSSHGTCASSIACVCDAWNVDVRRFDACLATSGTRDGREEPTANGGAPACHTGTPWAGSVVPRPPCVGPQKSECETAWRWSTCRRTGRKEEVHGKDADGWMENVCRRG